MARNVGDDQARLQAVEGAARTLVEAVLAYDEAIDRAGTQIDAGAAPAFAQGDDLDTLYERWLTAAHHLRDVLGGAA